MAGRRNRVQAAGPPPRDNMDASVLHDAMADLFKSNMVHIQGADHFMKILSTGVFNSKPFYHQEDFSYSDLSDDDDDDDEDNYGFYSHRAAHQPTEPHSQIKEITDEEAEKYEMKMKAEEERCKEKKEKNKRKKMRKKEKKRAEKENALQNNLPEKESGNSDSSKTQEESLSTENNAEANKSAECDETPSVTEADKQEERADNKEVLATINVKEEEEKELNLNNSHSVKSLPEKTCNQKPAQKTKSVEALQLKEETPEVVENPVTQKKKEAIHETNEEKSADSTADEYAKRSRELAGAGNRLAASGQFEMAIKCFTDAIKFNPREYRLFGNRSFCYERMQKFENALGDADLALCMEPNWIKGLFRKGKALCGLKRYYEASLIYEEVLQLDSTSAEAKQELKRAQTLHLMEMGFSWAQSNEALKTHVTLQEAVEALAVDSSPPGAGASRDSTDEPLIPENDGEEEEWTIPQTNRSRGQHLKVSGLIFNSLQSRSQSQSPTRPGRSSMKPELFSIWVGPLAPAVTYASLHELFSRVGAIYSIKMLLEHECAFVNYTKMEDCERAIQCFNGMVLEGAQLTVRHPIKGHGGLNLCKKECFFWRTTGCTRQDCTFRHIPEHKNIDKDKFTKRLGYANM